MNRGRILGGTLTSVAIALLLLGCPDSKEPAKAPYEPWKAVDADTDGMFIQGQEPLPPPRVVPDASAGDQAVCAVLANVGCSEGQDRAACLQVITEAHADTIAVNATCLVAQKTKEGVRGCNGAGFIRFRCL